MKSALISAVAGLLFLAGGFFVGFKMMPVPKVAPVVVAPPTTVKPPGAAVAMPAPQAITIDALTKTSQSMMALNMALSDREKHVAEREAKAEQEEDQIAAERVALEASHEKFKSLYNDFQSRLQLVEANQQDELQKQAALYDAMGPDQSIELLRATDDNGLARLFSVMETKSLAKLVGAWRTKYPDDGPRLLRMLNDTAQVIDKDKIALNDPFTTSTAATQAPAPADTSATNAAAPTTESAAPTPAAETAPEPTPAAEASAPASDAAPTPSPAPVAPSPDSSTPSDSQPLAPPPDAPAPKASSPMPSSTPATTDNAAPASNEVAPDATTPGATAEALANPAPAVPLDPANIPVARPASPADMDVNATDLPSRRAQPVNVTAATTN